MSNKILFDSIQRGKSEWLGLPEEIEIRPEMNGRHELPDISELVDDIIRHGQIQPVSIRKSAAKPVLTAGFSRWRAVKHINDNGLMPVPLKLRCSYTELTDQQAFLANISENRVRNATTALDDAYNLQRLINVYQMTEEQAAEAYRTTVAWVRGRLGLLELTFEAEAAVRSGRVKTDSATKALAKLSRDEQKKALAKPGKIERKDVTAPKAPKKPATIDAELRRLVTAALEDVAGMLADAEYGDFIEVDRKLLLDLYNYVEEIKPKSAVAA